MRIAACGVCHSDLHVVEGHLPEPLPLVLGHEAAGIVEEVGPGVETLETGDHVVLALVPSCGECEECRRGRPNFCSLGARMAAEGTLADGTSRLSLNGTTLHHFNSISSFAGHAVVPESAAVRSAGMCRSTRRRSSGARCSPATAPLRTPPTLRRARAWPSGAAAASASNVVQGARLAGASRIVAVDTRSEKLELARSLGATDAVQAGDGVDAVAAVKDVTGGGPDYAFEAIGSERAIQEAWERHARAAPSSSSGSCRAGAP